MNLFLHAIKCGHFDKFKDTISREDNTNDHVLAAKAYMGLGFVRQCKGELESSLDAYTNSLALWEDALGPNDPVNASISYTIGTVLIEMQRPFDAADNFSKALHLLKCTKDTGPGNRANILSTEGMLFRVLGEVRRAIDCFQNTLKFATVSFELGSLLSQIGEHINSTHCFNVALEIRKALLGDSFVVARIHYSLGVTIASQELKENTTFLSASHPEEALRICEQVFKAGHVQSAIIVHALGVLNERKGDSLSASAWFAKEYTMRKLLFGEDDESLAPVCVDLGTSYYNSGKYDLAISFFVEGLRFTSLDGNVIGFEVAEILYKIASCHDSLCNYDEALEKFSEVKSLAFTALR